MGKVKVKSEGKVIPPNHAVQWFYYKCLASDWYRSTQERVIKKTVEIKERKNMSKKKVRLNGAWFWIMLGFELFFDVCSEGFCQRNN